MDFKHFESITLPPEPLKLKTKPLCHISEAVFEAYTFVNSKGVTVTFTFNNVKVTLEPNETD